MTVPHQLQGLASCKEGFATERLMRPRMEGDSGTTRRERVGSPESAMRTALSALFRASTRARAVSGP